MRDGFILDDFRILLQRGCVDVLQADATRCGITGFLKERDAEKYQV